MEASIEQIGVILNLGKTNDGNEGKGETLLCGKASVKSSRKLPDMTSLQCLYLQGFWVSKHVKIRLWIVDALLNLCIELTLLYV